MDYTRETFAEAVLQSLGYPVTKLAVTDIMSWEAAEGGAWNGGARYNPLNTTEPMSGATDFNSVGVKNYTSWEQGLNATVKTLENGYYTDILNALSIGGTGDFGVTVGESPWGTETFAVTGQPTKALTSPTDTGAVPSSTPPDVTKYPGLTNVKGVYIVTWKDNLLSFEAGGTTGDMVLNWDNESVKTAKKYGPSSKAYLQWVNSTLPDLYGKQGGLTPSGGGEGNLTGLTLSTLTLKDLYIIIGVVLVGVLAVILIARAIKPAAQAVAPLAALAV